MQNSSRRKAIGFILASGICLVALAVALNVGWILLNLREIAMLVMGIVFFSLIIAGLVLNTIFLVREIRRNEQHDAFINAVTHELKTPIASIRLYLDTLKLRETSAEQREKFYNIMLADNDRLLYTVEQVLQAGRTGLKNRNISKQKIELDKLLKDSVALVRQRYNLTENTVKFLTPEIELKVVGDPQELQIAFTNLLDNAVKYSKQEIKVSIEAAELDAKNVAVRVTDTGIGIPHRELKRIFNRFYRAPFRLVQNIKGTGLGLSIVAAVVKRHGGRITAESAGLGKGSTFTIQLPKA